MVYIFVEGWLMVFCGGVVDGVLWWLMVLC